MQSMDYWFSKVQVAKQISPLLPPKKVKLFWDKKHGHGCSQTPFQNMSQIADSEWCITYQDFGTWVKRSSLSNIITIFSIFWLGGKYLTALLAKKLNVLVCIFFNPIYLLVNTTSPSMIPHIGLIKVEAPTVYAGIFQLLFKFIHKTM